METFKPTETLEQLKEYLDTMIDVSGNPHDHIFLYKHWLKRQKGLDIIFEKANEIFSKELVEEYIEDMRGIGWRPPEIFVPIETIPRDVLEAEIKAVIDTFKTTEAIIYQAARLEGRECVAHRTIRGWPDFIGSVIWGVIGGNNATKIKFANFKYQSGEEQILRWAAIYYMDVRDEFGD